MTQASRRTALFVSPIVPQQTGNGLAMRAGLMLEGLARHFDVHLVVVPASGGSLTVPDFVCAHTASTCVLDAAACIDTHAALIVRLVDPAEQLRQRAAYRLPWAARFSNAAAAAQIAERVAGVDVDVLCVMRLYLAPLLSPLLRALPRPPLVLLDLDDDDARFHARAAELHALHGDTLQAEAHGAEVTKYTTSFAALVAPCDAVLTASDDDARRLAIRHPAVHFAAVPNGYPALAAPRAAPRKRSGPLRLMFVANLSYLPNTDAADLLVAEVLPALRARGATARLDLVGAGAPADRVASWRRDSSVVVHGAVADLAPLYADADIAVVPLRAGGGTRIKILEAFAHGVPVVSSTLGAEGLDVEAGTHLLVADDSADFADACLRLGATPDLGTRLVANAAELHRRHYTPQAVHAKLDAVVTTAFSRRTADVGPGNSDPS